MGIKKNTNIDGDTDILMKSARKNLLLKLEAFAAKGRLNRKLADLLCTDLFWILITAAIFRSIYYSLLCNTQVYDSSSYLNDHSNIWKGEINSFRTPVYPYFIKLIRHFGEQHLIRNIVLVQSMFSFLNIIAFYKIMSVALKTRGVVIAATMLFVVMLPIINFDKTILTESLSVSCIVLFIMLMASYLQNQTFAKAFMLTIYTFFALMLRPSFITLLPIMILFWFMRLILFKKDKKKCLLGLATSVFIILLVHGYCSLNKKNNGFYGLSTVTNFNQLNIIIQSKMYNNGNDVGLINEITNDFSKPLSSVESLYYLNNITQKYKPERISTFITTCIKQQPFVYIKRIVRSTIELQTSNIFINYAEHKKGVFPRLIIDLEFFLFYTTFNKLFLFLFIDFIFIIIHYVRLKQVPWFSMFLWAIVVTQILVVIIGSTGDCQRLLLGCIPCIIIILFTYIDKVCYAIDYLKWKQKRKLA